MKMCKLQLIAAGLSLLVPQLLAQNLKLANIALGMSESEVKTALNSNAPSYIGHPSAYTGMHYLVAETEAESYVFTFIDGKAVAFSVVHLLPPGQLPFLPPGQQPTVAVLRGLIAKQTWAPAEINKGDAWWISDSNGAPLPDASLCRPTSGEAWLPAGPIPSSKPGERSAKSTEGLMKPSVTSYPANCGVSIHLNQTPAESEGSVVTSVRYQVLDIKAMNAFRAKQTHQETQGGLK
jgi:hypothetical protein